MFTVRYGNDQQRIFNANCQIVNLMNHIKQTCGYPEYELEIADESTGQVIFLTDCPNEYATQYIKSRSNYVLVQVQSTISNDSLSS